MHGRGITRQHVAQQGVAQAGGCTGGGCTAGGLHSTELRGTQSSSVGVNACPSRLGLHLHFCVVLAVHFEHLQTGEWQAEPMSRTTMSFQRTSPVSASRKEPPRARRSLAVAGRDGCHSCSSCRLRWCRRCCCLPLPEVGCTTARPNWQAAPQPHRCRALLLQHLEQLDRNLQPAAQLPPAGSSKVGLAVIMDGHHHGYQVNRSASCHAVAPHGADAGAQAGQRTGYRRRQWRRASNRTPDAPVKAHMRQQAQRTRTEKSPLPAAGGPWSAPASPDPGIRRWGAPMSTQWPAALHNMACSSCTCKRATWVPSCGSL